MKVKYLLLPALMVMLACEGSPAAKADAPLRLATYRVPEGYQERVANIMNNSFRRLGGSDHAVAAISVLPNGMLAVLATDDVQKGFAQIVADLEGQPLPKKENAYLDLWVVEGKPGTGERGPRLASLKPVLDEVGSGNPIDFQYLDKLGVSGLIGERVRAESPQFGLRCAINRDGERLLINLNIHGNTGDMETQVTLAPDQYLVIGESSRAVQDKEGRAEKRNVYFILRARVG